MNPYDHKLCINNHQTDYERRKNIKIVTYSTYNRLGSVNVEESKTTVLVEEIIIILNHADFPYISLERKINEGITSEIQ